MRRAEILQALDGRHPQLGRTVAFALNGFILLLAVSITLESMESLPARVHRLLYLFEHLVLAIFTAEYLTRLICAPRPLRYALSFWGIVDLLACLPILFLFNPDLAAIRSLRVIRLVRLLKLMRTSRALERLMATLRSVQGELTMFVMLAGMMLYIASVGIYIFEHEAQPDAFGSIPKSMWWAIVSFTTVGYGDTYPITAQGRIFTAAILFIGLGVIAVPAAVITSALIEQSRTERKHRERHEISHSTIRTHALRPRHGRSGPGTGRR